SIADDLSSDSRLSSKGRANSYSRRDVSKLRRHHFAVRAATGSRLEDIGAATQRELVGLHRRAGQLEHVAGHVFHPEWASREFMGADLVRSVGRIDAAVGAV